jgi:LPXTG-motif cell wall-anchored protein
MVAIAAAAIAILAGVLHLVRTGAHSQSHRLTHVALMVGVVSLTVSITVHAKWGHGPGTVAPMGCGRLLSEHEAFPAVGAMLLLGLGLALLGSRRRRNGSAA